MSEAENNDVKKQKKVKKKGPIRFEAILPVALLIALLIAYFSFFFDSNLRSGIEFVGTMVNGAEVNVKNIDTDFLGGSFVLSGLQITDKEAPQRNVIQIGSIKFQFLWDALLRMKFVVNEASINNIQAYVPRQRPGRLVPKSSDNKRSETLAKVEDSVLDQAKEQFNENVLGDIANVIGGADPSDQLKNLQMNLKADQRIKELEKVLQEKEAAWKERLQNLPKQEEINALVARAKKVKLDANNPIELAKGIKELDQIFRQADKIVKDFKQASDNLQTDVGGFNNSFKELEQLAQQDLKDLQGRLKIPDLNVADFSKGLFGRMFAEQLAKYRKYLVVAKEYMPPKKTAEEKQPELIPRARGEGRDVKFPITTGYPLFWLQKARISSEPTDSEFSGKIAGEVTDITTRPSAIKNPARISVQGDFPKQQIYGLNTLITIDHRTAEPVETLTASIDSYPVQPKQLSDSPDVKFAIANAKGRIDIRGAHQNENIQMKISNVFQQVGYEIDAKSSIVKDILQGTVNGLPDIQVNADISGPWNNLHWKIDSNLGRELGRGFKDQVNKKVEEAKAKLKQYIDQRINAEKQKLQSEFNKVKSQIDGVINSKKKEIDSAKSKAEKEINSEKKKAEKSGKKSLEQKGKKLLKDLGF